MKDINKFINESLRDLDDILDEVSEWFWNNCDEDGYDNRRQRREDFEAMADKANDMMVDQCIDYIDLSDEESDKYYDDIVDKLAELCARELDDM
jgi:hypothetical protein